MEGIPWPGGYPDVEKPVRSRINRERAGVSVITRVKMGPGSWGDRCGLSILLVKSEEAIHMAGEDGKNNLKKIVILSLIIPVIGFVVLDLVFPSQRWTSIPVHAMSETTGLTIGLVTVLVLLSTNPGTQEIRSVSGWIAAALTGMAVLDGFHSAVLPGNTAIWLHSMAALTGGALFTGIWWGRRTGKNTPGYYIAGAVAVFAIVLGTVSVAYPGIVPFTAMNTTFPLLADGINVTGGALFVIAAAGLYFLSMKTGGTVFSLFSVFCILNGLAGLFFPFSSSWTAVWWFWHIVRLAAYLLLLIFVYDMIIPPFRNGRTTCGNGNQETQTDRV
jgi:hypothetical protein